MSIHCLQFEAMEPAIAIVRVVEDNGLLQLLDPQATAWMQVQV